LLQSRGSSLIEPLLLSKEAELVSCCFTGDDSAAIGTRDRRVICLNFGLDGVRKKKDASWQSCDVPHVAKWAGYIAGSKKIVFSSGDQVFVQCDDVKTWKESGNVSFELLQAFSCAASSFNPAKEFC
jgi:hypothetical protein